MAASESPKQFLDHHFAYEQSMLQGTFEVLNTKTIEMNALIESFAIHARAFLEFFQVKSKNGYCASDFTTSKYQAQFLNKVSKSITDKLNTQIAHMTPKRTSQEEEKLTGEDRVELLDAILKELVEFKKALKPEFGGGAVAASGVAAMPTTITLNPTNAIITLGGSEDRS